MSSSDPQYALIGHKKVKKIMNDCSAMHIWRLLNNKKLMFPRPIKINGLLYWNEREVIAWLRKQMEARV